MANASLKDFERRLARLPMAAKKAAQAALDKSADELVAAQRSLVPRDSGKLAASIHWEATDELTRTITAGGEATMHTDERSGIAYDYAFGQEFGTTRQPAQPFFWPAYRLTRKRIRGRINRAISKGVKEAFENG